MLSPTDAASQEDVVGSAQRVVVARARAPRDAAVQHCLEYFGSEHPEFELEGSARSVVQFDGVLLEAAPCVVYAPIDLDGQVSIMVDVPTEVHKLVRPAVHLARCLYAKCGGGVRHPLRACVSTWVSVLVSDTVRPDVVHTITITPIIFLSCSRDRETTPASSA